MLVGEQDDGGSSLFWLLLPPQGYLTLEPPWEGPGPSWEEACLLHPSKKPSESGEAQTLQETLQGDSYGCREGEYAYQPASNRRDVLGVGSSVALRHRSRGWLTAWGQWHVMK